jgi:hypothetical protein
MQQLLRRVDKRSEAMESQKRTRANRRADNLREQLYSMQLAAMANALAGQSLPDDFDNEYAELELRVLRLTHGSKCSQQPDDE